MVKMKNIVSLKPLYKRDSKGKIRIWTVEVGYNNEGVAGIRSISGLVDGEKVTSVWNMSRAKNVGRANATTAKGQAEFEAQAQWTKKADKEYFAKKKDVDSYELFKPMLAHDFTKTPVVSGYTQPKLDGIRCVVDKNGMHTRGGKPINSCPHIWESVKHIIKDNPNIVLDGELYNHKLKADFQKIISLVRKVKCRPEEIAESAELVEYHIYDMFDRDSEDMLFTDRAQWLKDHIGNVSRYTSVVLVKTTKCKDIAKIDEMYGKYTEAGFEGQMVRQNNKYECKRSKGLLKRKEFITEEFDVVGVEEGQGAWTGYAKKFTLKLPDGRTFSSGVRGSQAQLKALLKAKQKPNWATCRFFELSNDGVPRFPVVIDYGVGVRDD
jgi:DNA ligase 1